MTAEIIVLRLVHILGGIFWVGAMLFNALFLFPALAAAGPAAGPVMGGLQRRKLMTVLPIVAVVTILAGIRLMWITSAGFQGEYFASPTGRTLAIGAAASILAFLAGILVSRPTAMRSMQVGAALAAAPDGPEKSALAAEAAALRRRSTMWSHLVMTLLLVAAGTMAIARYLG